VSDEPVDPFADPAHPYSGMLDRAKTLRFAVLDARDLPAVFEGGRRVER
jgi:hypothetical protein